MTITHILSQGAASMQMCRSVTPKQAELSNVWVNITCDKHQYNLIVHVMFFCMLVISLCLAFTGFPSLVMDYGMTGNNRYGSLATCGCPILG